MSTWRGCYDGGAGESGTGGCFKHPPALNSQSEASHNVSFDNPTSLEFPRKNQGPCASRRAGVLVNDNRALILGTKETRQKLKIIAAITGEEMKDVLARLIAAELKRVSPKNPKG